MINKEKLSTSVLSICEHLKKHQFQAFIVGGSIRDLLIGKIPKDWDVATNALPENVIKIFNSDFKVIPTGLKHGTVTIVLNNDNIEITTFRTEGDYLDGRRPSQVHFVSSIEEDLSRRDLTINSIAYDPILDKIIDPFNGIGDIQKKIIRTVGDPNQRIREDGLRLIRIYRFASQLCYTIDKNTSEAIPYNFETFRKVATERITVELVKLLNGNAWKEATYLMYKSGLLNEIIPDFKSQYFQLILPNLAINRLELTMDVLKNIPDDSSLNLKLAIILHQLSGIKTLTQDLFPKFNTKYVLSILRKLKLTNRNIDDITHILRTHLKPLPYKNDNKEVNKDYEIRKLQHFVGFNYFQDYLNFYIGKARYLGENINDIKILVKEYIIRSKTQPPVEIQDLVVNGDFILNFFQINKNFASQREFIGLCLEILRERIEYDLQLNNKKDIISILMNIKKIYLNCSEVDQSIRIIATDHIRKLYTDNSPSYHSWENSHTYQLSIWLILCILRRKKNSIVIFDGTNFNLPSHPNYRQKLIRRFQDFSPFLVQLMASEEEIKQNYEERLKEKRTIKTSDAGLDIYYRYIKATTDFPKSLEIPRNCPSFEISTRDELFETNLSNLAKLIIKDHHRLIILSGNVLSGKSYLARLLKTKLEKK